MERTKLASLYRGTLGNVNKHIEELLRPYGIGHGQLDYLIMIDARPGVNQKELGKELNVGKAGVTKAVKILLDQALVRRETDDNDRRNYQLVVTDKGAAIISVLQKMQDEVTGLLFDGISETEKAQFISLLSKVHDNSKKVALLDAS